MLTFLTPLPLCVLSLNSCSYLRESIFRSFLIFRTSVCLRYWMCELECRYTWICVEMDFKKETSPDKVISLKRLSVFGRQSGDLQTDLACWIRFWAHSSGGSFWRAEGVNGPCTVCRQYLTEQSGCHCWLVCSSHLAGTGAQLRLSSTSALFPLLSTTQPLLSVRQRRGRKKKSETSTVVG